MREKIFKTSFFYSILAMISGVFYREFTKFQGFTGKTSLSVTHVHLFALGAAMFLMVLILDKNFAFSKHEKFKKFFNTYNIGVIFMVIMLYIRGINQVLNTSLSKGADAAISGLAGLSHIIIAAGIIRFYLILKDRIKEDSIA